LSTMVVRCFLSLLVICAAFASAEPPSPTAPPAPPASAVPDPSNAFLSVKDDITTNSTHRELQDSHGYCSWWASMGECRGNPHYMIHYCKSSCGVSQYSDCQRNYIANNYYETCADYGYGSCSWYTNPASGFGCGHGWVQATCRKTCGTCLSNRGLGSADSAGGCGPVDPCTRSRANCAIGSNRVVNGGAYRLDGVCQSGQDTNLYVATSVANGLTYYWTCNCGFVQPSMADVSCFYRRSDAASRTMSAYSIYI